MSMLTDVRQALQQCIDRSLDVSDCRFKLSRSAESVHISKTAGSHPQTFIGALSLIGKSSSIGHLPQNNVKAQMEKRGDKDAQAATTCEEALL